MIVRTMNTSAPCTYSTSNCNEQDNMLTFGWIINEKRKSVIEIKASVFSSRHLAWAHVVATSLFCLCSKSRNLENSPDGARNYQLSGRGREESKNSGNEISLETHRNWKKCNFKSAN